jgi:hypothetical protein
MDAKNGGNMKFDLSEYIADSVDLDPVGTARKEIRELILVGDMGADVIVYDDDFKRRAPFIDRCLVGTVDELFVSVESDAGQSLAFECVLAFLRGDADAKSRAERLVDSVITQAISWAKQAGGLQDE